MGYSTNWAERVEPAEATQFEALAQVIVDLQKRRMQKAGSPLRGLHRKPIAAARGQLRIERDIPAELKVGLFKSEATYDAWVRFSNGSGSHQPDGKADVRGMAVKVLGVEGAKALAGSTATTQDFLAIQLPATPFADPEQFVAFVRAAVKPATLLPSLISQLGLLPTLGVLRRLIATTRYKVPSYATTRFYSALPVRYGPYAAKYAFFPRQTDGGPAGGGDDFYRADMLRRLEAGPLAYDVMVQLFVDEQRTPIENPTVEWRESDSPFVKVGELWLPKQSPTSVEGEQLAAQIEAASFDPWHALEEHRPLGAMMRARAVAYLGSTRQRNAAPEP